MALDGRGSQAGLAGALSTVSAVTSSTDYAASAAGRDGPGGAATIAASTAATATTAAATATAATATTGASRPSDDGTIDDAFAAGFGSVSTPLSGSGRSIRPPKLHDVVTGESALTSFASVPEAGGLEESMANTGGRWAAAAVTRRTAAGGGAGLAGGGSGGGAGARRAAKGDARSRDSGRSERGGRPEGEDLKGEDLKVPGMSLRKVSSMASLPDRSSDIKVRVHKSKQFNAALPASMRDMRLVFLVPKTFKISSLVSRVQTLLQLKRPVTVRLYGEQGGGQLEATRTVNSYFESHGDTSDGFLHISIDLPPATVG